MVHTQNSLQWSFIPASSFFLRPLPLLSHVVFALSNHQPPPLLHSYSHHPTYRQAWTSLLSNYRIEGGRKCHFNNLIPFLSSRVSGLQPWLRSTSAPAGLDVVGRLPSLVERTPPLQALPHALVNTFLIVANTIFRPSTSRLPRRNGLQACSSRLGAPLRPASPCLHGGLIDCRSRCC